MGRQTRTLPSGEGKKFVTIRGTTGATTQRIPNSGIAYITATTAESYVLDAPVEGCELRILRIAGGTSAAVIRANTLGAQAVSFNTTGGNTIMTLCSTIDMSIHLIGVNSTQWFIVNARPEILATATSVVASTT